MPKKSDLALSEAERAEFRQRALASIAAMTDEEDARVTAAALSDPDNPPGELRDPLPYAEHQERMKRLRGQRGPQKAPTKQLISLRLDPDVLSHFQGTGAGWQTRINDILRKAAGLR